MQTFYDHAGAICSYVVALLTLTFAYSMEHANHIAQILGFILLIARLIVEVPSAIRVLKNKFRKPEDE